jgi:hypothetical protein
VLLQPRAEDPADAIVEGYEEVKSVGNFGRGAHKGCTIFGGVCEVLVILTVVGSGLYKQNRRRSLMQHSTFT